MPRPALVALAVFLAAAVTYVALSLIEGKDVDWVVAAAAGAGAVAGFALAAAFRRRRATSR